MGSLYDAKALRGACEIAGGGEPPAASGRRARCKCPEGPGGLKPNIFPRRRKAKGIVVEVFAGSCAFGKAAARKGYEAWCFDIAFGHDLLSTQVFYWVASVLGLDAVIAELIATPCSSFSRARRGVPAPPLRDDKFVLGLPALKPGDQEKVKTGSILCERSAALARKAKRLGELVVLENLQTSWLWKTSWMCNLQSRDKFQRDSLHQCRFGAASMKPTSFLNWAPSEKLFLPTGRCGRNDGICRRTNKRHAALSGFCAGGWQTSEAAKYPKQLCDRLVQWIDEFYLERRGARQIG